MIKRNYAFGLWLAWLVFVIYGSLIPFEYRAYSFDEALTQFANIRYLTLGIESRADWIANIILYIPLSFLACLWVVGSGRITVVHYLNLVVVLAFVFAVAVSVEFAQIFFAPRTVSINDLMAETLGSLVGMALWLFGRDYLLHLLRSFVQGGHQSMVAMLSAYGLFYIAQSIFPFDFVVSPEELSWKRDSDNYGLLIASDCSSFLRCLARLLGEALAIIPLGVLTALAYPTFGLDSGGGLRRVLFTGAMLGIFIEFAQFFMASGVSQGLSVLMRSFGLAAGVFIGHILRQLGADFLARTVRQFTRWLAIPYLLVLVALAGWFNETWLPLTEFSARLADVRVMPFYYHYYSTEPQAMASLLANAAMYMPLGLAVWAGRAAGARKVLGPGVAGKPNHRKGVIQLTAVAAMGLALLVELGKVLVPSKHPDFTNLLIAAVAAVLTYSFMRWLEGALADKQALPVTSPSKRETITLHTQLESKVIPGVNARNALRLVPLPEEGGAGAGAVATEPRASGPGIIGLLYALLLVAAMGLGVVGYPLLAPLLVFALLVYGVLLWRWPLLWFFVLPLLAPLLDLSQHTGRLVLAEFDLFVLATLLISTVRGGRSARLSWPNPLLPMVLALLWLSWLMSTVLPLWPWLSDESQRQISSHSLIETWLVAKGLLWALLLVPVIRRTTVDQLDLAKRYILWSLSAGLVCLSLVVIAERQVFVGLSNFDNVFRVTGTFSSMRTGGAYIEAYIAFAFPALLVWVLTQRNWLCIAGGLAGVSMAAYAMLVTYSRVGYVALVIGFMVVFLAWLARRDSFSRLKKLVVFASLLAVGIGLLTPVLSGGFAQYRLARSADDFSFRLNHWQQALGLMGGGVLDKVFGEGFGQYPIYHLFNADETSRASVYMLKEEEGGPYLQLRAGRAAYLEQVVNVDPHQQYQLSLRVRRSDYADAAVASDGAGKALTGDALSVFLCEKALLYSFGCIEKPLQLGADNAEWQALVIPVSSGDLGGSFWSWRPVKLSLHVAAGNLDVDAVSLQTIDGRELIANGGFNNGVKRWLFTTDQDLAWHIHQQWVEMYFAQGVLGLVAMVLLLVVLAGLVFRPLIRGDLETSGFTAAFLAFLTVGLLGSTMDAARMSMLFYLVTFGAIFVMGAKSSALPRGLVKRSRSSDHKVP